MTETIDMKKTKSKTNKDIQEKHDDGARISCSLVHSRLDSGGEIKPLRFPKECSEGVRGFSVASGLCPLGWLFEVFWVGS